MSGGKMRCPSLKREREPGAQRRAGEGERTLSPVPSPKYLGEGSCSDDSLVAPLRSSGSSFAKQRLRRTRGVRVRECEAAGAASAG